LRWYVLTAVRRHLSAASGESTYRWSDKLKTRDRVREREPLDVGTTWYEEPIRSDLSDPRDDMLLPQDALERAPAAADVGNGDAQFATDGARDRELPPELWLQTAEPAAPQSADEPWAPLIPWRVVLPAGLAALVLVALGVGILALAGRPHAPVVAPVVGTATAAPTTNSTPATATAPPAPPTMTIKFAVIGTPTITQQCNGTDPLQPLTFRLVNSSSAVAVDWFASIPDATPDGKLPWAVAADPYGTLPAGQSATLTIIPDPSLCAQLAQKDKPVTYHVNVMYAGIGTYAITDTITPPAIVPPFGG
jgi:hypothetical protein